MAKMNTTSDDVRASVSSIYSELLSKRQAEREKKEEERRQKEEAKREGKEKEKQEGKDDKVIKMTKKQRREAELDNWKEIVVGLTGDDLEYSDTKSKKKKYKKWIDDEDPNKVVDAKKKKVKKKNYNKEFEPELNMLRTLVSEQNKFTADLQKRFQNAVGPANKDAMPPNKTMVDLASAIVSARSNSLGVLREIGGLKKAIAELYMKQKKLDADLSGSGGTGDNSDLMLMGSSIMSGLDNQYGMPTPNIAPEQVMTAAQQVPPTQSYSNTYGYEEVHNVTPKVPESYNNASSASGEEFDPSSWQGFDLPDQQVMYENIPKTVVVEKNAATGSMRFKAVRNDNGQEIVNCPGLPTVDPSTLQVNEKDNTVRGNFDEIYNLVVV